MLDELIAKQRQIFASALKFVKATGRIVYGTCSILQEENEAQVTYFLEKNPVELAEPFWKILPHSNEMDGFFGAVFKLKN